MAEREAYACSREESRQPLYVDGVGTDGSKMVCDRFLRDGFDLRVGSIGLQERMINVRIQFHNAITSIQYCTRLERIFQADFAKRLK